MAMQRQINTGILSAIALYSSCSDEEAIQGREGEEISRAMHRIALRLAACCCNDQLVDLDEKSSPSIRDPGWSFDES